jgi:hypothetical protein
MHSSFSFSFLSGVTGTCIVLEFNVKPRKYNRWVGVKKADFLECAIHQFVHELCFVNDICCTVIVSLCKNGTTSEDVVFACPGN